MSDEAEKLAREIAPCPACVGMSTWTQKHCGHCFGKGVNLGALQKLRAVIETERHAAHAAGREAGLREAETAARAAVERIRKLREDSNG